MNYIMWRMSKMTLKLTPCGFDLGNGWSKIVLDNKASKIPNWHIGNKPKGQLTKKMIVSKPMAFPLLTNNGIRWFGQDTLSQPGYQEIDADKYNPDYIRLMFKAVLYRWLTQQNIDPKWLSDKRLKVVCGMPPEPYQDRSAQNKALKAFKSAFDEKRPQYIKIPDSAAIAFFTEFGGLAPETLSWRAANKLKNGYTLLGDFGYGTTDLCLFHSSQELPISTRSLNNGLLHSHNETNPVAHWIAELNTMRGTNDLSTYGNVTKSKLRSIARQIDLAQLVVFGGGIKLFDKNDISDLRGYASEYWQGDEFTNARMFEKLGNNET